MLMRAELARPGLQLLAPEQYNQLFPMQGTIMLLFYATPVVFGFANYVLPLQIGMPRRYPDYLPTDGFTTPNTISTIGSFVLGASVLPFVWNVVKSWRYGELTTADDPWGYGNSLEWATSCPPPRHNFTSLPRVRSERPAFELHHPQLVHRLRIEAHPHRDWQPLQAAESSPHLAIGTTWNHAGETPT